MKAIILEKPERFIHATIDEPVQPGPGEALVEVLLILLEMRI